MQEEGDLVGVDDDVDDLQAAVTTWPGAGLDVDGEHPREEVSPGTSVHAGRGELELERRRGEHRTAGEIEQEQLLWWTGTCAGRGPRVGDDAWPRAMSIGKATSITDEVLAGRGNQGAQLGEELVRRHDDAASATREVEADSTVGEQVHGVEAEGRAKQVLADAFEAFFVAAIHSCGGVQIHAVGERDEVLLPGHGGGGGGRGQGELNARGEGGVDVEVVGQTGVGEVGCHSIENPGEVALVEVGQGMEDDVAVGLLLEGAVCGQHVEVDKKAPVRSEALHDGDEAGVQALHRGQSLPNSARTKPGSVVPSRSVSSMKAGKCSWTMRHRSLWTVWRGE